MLATQNGAFYADFDQSIGSLQAEQAAAGGSYTVLAGETLRSIASKLWGDTSLWYKLAEANGMTGSETLAEGSQLVVPAGVSTYRNAADTFRPYDPNAAMGNLEPGEPYQAVQAKPKGNKCGMFGTILLVAVSVAVSFALPALAPGVFGGFLGGIGAAMIGSVVSQGVGLATRIQDKFSFKQVAIAGISAAVGGQLGKAFSNTAVAGSKFLTDVVRGAASSAISQGIAVATGLQKKFDFAGVAAAGLGAGLGGAMSRELISPLKADGTWAKTETTWNRQGNFGHNVLVSSADAIGQAAARSLVEGSSFGDNLMAALPSAIGNTLGSALGKAIREPVWEKRIEKLSNEKDLQEGLRGEQAVREQVGYAVEAGMTNKQIRKMLAASGTQAYLWDRQYEINEARIEAAYRAQPAALSLWEGEGEAASLHLAAAAGSAISEADWGDGKQLGREWSALNADEKKRFASGNFNSPEAQHGAIHNHLYAVGRLPGQVTPAELAALGASKANSERHARPLSDAMGHYGITSLEERAAYLAQVFIESNRLTKMEENLNYGAPRILEIFGKYVKTYADAKRLAGNPEALANRVYANRNGNGNEASGDGWRFRGRGHIMLTGKDKYAPLGLLSNPDALFHPAVAGIASAHWWHTEGFTKRTGTVLSKTEFYRISQKVNNPSGRPHAAGPRWDLYLTALDKLRP